MNEVNDKGERHGYWEQYYSNGNPWYKGNYNNGVQADCWEWYYFNGNLLIKEFYL